CVYLRSSAVSKSRFQPGHESRVLAAEGFGETVAESGEEGGELLRFGAPCVALDVEQLAEGGVRDVEPFAVQGGDRGHEADRCLFGVGAAFDAVEDPEQDAQVLPVARPEELAVGALAEP